MDLFLQLPSVKVVVFDFNGTLFDDLHVAYGSVQEIFRTYGISCPTLEQYREEITADYMEFYYKYGFPRTTTGDDLNVIRNKFYKANGRNAKIRTGVKNILLDLADQGVYTTVVSAESLVNLYRQLIWAGNLQRLFDFIKPEAWGEKGKEKALLDVAEIFGKNPNEMIYVDDSVDGLTSAKNLGVIPVAFVNKTGYNSGHRLAKVTEISIQEIGELADIDVTNWGRL